MTFLVWLFRGALAVLLLTGMNGCLPSSQGELEEEKESHFIAGKSSINSMDYRGAIEEFEKALEMNPRNAKAHFQLGWLYEEKDPDPAAAIYHYERFLKLRPNSDNAEVIRQHITNCKQDLAKTILPLPITPGLQRQIEQTIEENKRLKEENERWKAYFASRPQALTNPPAGSAPSALSTQARSPSAQVIHAENLVLPNSNTGTRQPAASMRTHTVQSGETATAIARKYGIRLDALLSANPGLEPRRMRVGQKLNIPSS